jgi:hypothetical protein
VFGHLGTPGTVHKPGNLGMRMSIYGVDMERAVEAVSLVSQKGRSEKKKMVLCLSFECRCPLSNSLEMNQLPPNVIMLIPSRDRGRTVGALKSASVIWWK